MSKSKYQNILDSRLIELNEQLSAIGGQDPYSISSYSDENTQDDDASEREEHTRVIALREATEAKIVAVKEALDRLEKGNYGVCVNCGAEIDQARLEIIPEASYCLACQSKFAN